MLLDWYAPGPEQSPLLVYRRTQTSDWQLLGQVFADGTGNVVYEDRAIAPGQSYGYKLGYTSQGATNFTADTWLTVPVVARFALTGTRPNPAPRTDAAIAFSLATNERATLDLFDRSGRRVLGREVGSLGAGDHVLRLGSDVRLDAGMYWLRLVQGANKSSMRVVVTE